MEASTVDRAFQVACHQYLPGLASQESVLIIAMMLKVVSLVKILPFRICGKPEYWLLQPTGYLVSTENCPKQLIKFIFTEEEKNK